MHDMANDTSFIQSYYILDSVQKYFKKVISEIEIWERKALTILNSYSSCDIYQAC